MSRYHWYRDVRAPGRENRTRFLAGFTPAQRQEAMSAAGLPFAKMQLAQQQRSLELALGANAEPLRSNARPIRWVHPGQQLTGGGG